MPTVRLTWTDTNSGLAQEDAIIIYRATSEFDEASLPAPLATLPPNSVSYDDSTALSGTLYWYAVAAEKNGELAVSFTGQINSDIMTTPLARYWRLRVFANQSGGPTPATSAAKVEFRGSLGGPDLATGGFASASTVFSGSFPASAAFDTNPSSFWVSTNFAGNYGTHWLAYDFGVPVRIRELAISKRPDTFGQNEAVTYGALQYSTDNVNWVTAWEFFTPPTWGAGAETRVFSRQPVTAGAPIWRVRSITTQNNPDAPAWANVEFRTSPGGPDVTTGGVAITNSAALPADNAFDDNPSTFWRSGIGTGSAPWVGYWFGSKQNVVEVALQVAQDASGANWGTTSGAVEFSFDNVTWTTAWTFTTPANWQNNSNEVRVFTKP